MASWRLPGEQGCLEVVPDPGQDWAGKGAISSIFASAAPSARPLYRQIPITPESHHFELAGHRQRKFWRGLRRSRLAMRIAGDWFCPARILGDPGMTTPANLDPFARSWPRRRAQYPLEHGCHAYLRRQKHRAIGEPQVAADLPEILSGANSLAVAANPLLNLIPQIHCHAASPGSRAVCATTWSIMVQLFEQRAARRKVSPEMIAARYALYCA